MPNIAGLACMLKVKSKKLIVLIILFCLAVLGSFVIRNKFYHQSNFPTKSPDCCHNSYFSQKDFYEKAYEFAGPKKSNDKISGIIVNHHLLADSFIAEAFNQIATTAPVTVLLISPNHFNAGKGSVIASADAWQTPYGRLDPDTKLIDQLSGLVVVEESPFNQEHGVSGIVGFIKKSLPNAKVVPLIFRDKISLGQATAAAGSIYKILDDDKSTNYIVVGSFDFSHYLTNSAADFHDVKSMTVLENLDVPGSYNLDIDSRPGLAFFLQLMKNGQNGKFTQLEHSNSAKLAKLDTLENTSYITGYFSNGSNPTKDIQTLLVLPPIQGSSLVSNSLNRFSKTWSAEYLERLFSGQDKTALYFFGEQDNAAAQLKRYGISDFLSKDEKTTFFSGRVKTSFLENSYKRDSLDIINGQVVINFNHPLLSDKVLKDGGTSVAYGITQSGQELTITILPIGVKDGVAKLLIGPESGKVLAEIANVSNVPQEIKTQIKNGFIIIK